MYIYVSICVSLDRVRRIQCFSWSSKYTSPVPSAFAHLYITTLSLVSLVITGAEVSAFKRE